MAISFSLISNCSKFGSSLPTFPKIMSRLVIFSRMRADSSRRRIPSMIRLDVPTERTMRSLTVSSPEVSAKLKEPSVQLKSE